MALSPDSGFLKFLETRVKIGAADRVFIRSLVPQSADFLVDKLSSRPALFAPPADEQTWRGALLGIRSLAKLVLDVIRACARSSEAADCDTTCYELVDDGRASRERMLARFAPTVSVYYVDRSAPMTRQSHPLRVMRAIAGTLTAFLLSVWSGPTPLRPSYIHIVRQCLIAHGHSLAARNRSSHIFRAYQLRADFVAAYLMEGGVKVNIVTHTGPLWPHLTRMLGNSVKLSNPYHVYEWERYEESSEVPEWELWGPQELPELEERYAGAIVPEHHDVLGVYTQGYWLRVLDGLGDSATLESYRRVEDALCDAVRGYAEQHPNVRVLLLPHPIERRHFKETGRHGYGELLSHPRIEADMSDDSSIMGFDRVGLGVTTFSTVGFDRLCFGLRTVFFVGDAEFVDWSVESPYHRLFMRDGMSLRAFIDSARRMTHASFMSEYLSDAPQVTDVRPFTG